MRSDPHKMGYCSPKIHLKWSFEKFLSGAYRIGLSKVQKILNQRNSPPILHPVFHRITLLRIDHSLQRKESLISFKSFP